MSRTDDGASKKYQDMGLRPSLASRTPQKCSRASPASIFQGTPQPKAASSCPRLADSRHKIKPLLQSSAKNRSTSKERNPVAGFLHDIGLEQYATILIQNGFDDMETLMDIEDEHMKSLGLPPGHMIKLRKRLRETNLSPSGAFCGDAPTGQMYTVVQRSWLHVQELGAEVVGDILSKKLFQLAPETKQLFPIEVRNRYRDWSTTEVEEENDLHNSPAIRRLFGKTVNAVGSAVAGLQDMNKLVPQLTSLGMRHVGYGVTEEHLAIAGKALVLTLEEGLRDMFTPEVEHAWTMVYSFISATMVSGLRAKRADLSALPEPQSRQSSQSTNPAVGNQVQGGLEVYRIDRHLHKAIFGDVYAATGVASGRSFALKVMDKETVQHFENPEDIHDDHFCESPLCEVRFNQIMKGLEHVMQLEEHFSDQVYHYLVSDLATGGDLLEALRLRPEGFDEKQTQFLIRDAAKGLANLHARGLAMQDVSLENFLLYVGEDGERRVSVCDPGQAVRFTVDPISGCENPVPFNGFVAKEFRPPELYAAREYYATKVDAWCLGYSTFFLLVGDRLFQSADPAVGDPDWVLFRNGELSKLFEQKGATSILSAQAKDFITRLLEPNAQHRMSVKSALWHPWLVERIQCASQVPRIVPTSLAVFRAPSPARKSVDNTATVEDQSSFTFSGDGHEAVGESEDTDQQQGDGSGARTAEVQASKQQDFCKCRTSREVGATLQLMTNDDAPTLLKRLQEKPLQGRTLGTKSVSVSPR